MWRSFQICISVPLAQGTYKLINLIQSKVEGEAPTIHEVIQEEVTKIFIL